MFPVEVRSLNDPKPGWTLERALDMLEQGYRVERVSALSGYIVPFLKAQWDAAHPKIVDLEANRIHIPESITG